MTKLNYLTLAALAALGIISASGREQARADSTKTEEATIENYLHTSKDEAPEKIKHPEKLCDKQQKLGNDFVDALREDGEYDLVQAYPFPHTSTDKETGKKRIIYDLVVRACEKDEYGCWPVFGINVDCMCRTLMEEERVAFIIDWSDVIRVYSCSGSIITTESLSHKAAENIEKLLGQYIGNNKDACKDWVKYVQKTQGPRGPD